VREPAKVVGGLLVRLADNRHIQAAADYLSDFSEGHTLVGDAVIAGSRRTLLQCQPVEWTSIEPVHRGPAVEPVTHICRNPVLAREVDECRNEAEIAGLAAAGVRRISLATPLYRAAMTGFLDAARELKDAGQFDFLNRCVTTPELNELMRI